jgi:predicted nucleic acid-binding Zn ribbon protein
MDLCPRCAGTGAIFHKHCSFCGAAVYQRNPKAKHIAECPYCGNRVPRNQPVGVEACSRCGGEGNALRRAGRSHKQEAN